MHHTHTFGKRATAARRPPRFSPTPYMNTLCDLEWECRSQYMSTCCSRASSAWHAGHSTSVSMVVQAGSNNHEVTPTLV